MAVEWVTGKALGVIARQHFARSARRRLRRYSRNDDLIRLGPEALYIHQYVPGGYRHDAIEFRLKASQPIDVALCAAPPNTLPLPAEELVQRIKQERLRLEDGPTTADHEWNGHSVAVERIASFARRGAREDPVLLLDVSESDHAAAKVCSQTWQKWFDEGDGSLPQDRQTLFDGIPGMLHAIGLNATLVTADGQLILTRRNSRMSSGRGGQHISVNEGMQPTDRSTAAHLDPHLGLARGLQEELGLVIDPRNVRFHTAMFDLRRYQFGLLGHVDLRSTRVDAATILAKRQIGDARDKDENTSLETVPWEPDAILERLKDPSSWIAHGWLNLLLSAMDAFPHEREAFAELLNNSTVSFNARQA